MQPVTHELNSCSLMDQSVNTGIWGILCLLSRRLLKVEGASWVLTKYTPLYIYLKNKAAVFDELIKFL
ncbi:hypothetical protein E4U42_002116 [Claviceps africana]|uniref:Uncharacterized protein n=1 Tax=Claviceps africana TaxID=83212 RepID=A0A8K0NHP8_9HYPO|nr:hypothetical protein E4U42_002116 [Claviceps africana]